MIRCMDNLYEEVLEKLGATRETRQEIAEGACVGREWLNKIAKRKIPDPSYFRLKRVKEYLTSGTVVTNSVDATTIN